MYWGWRRPEPGEGLIALLLMLVINLLLLPVLGMAGIMSDNENEKVKGTIMLICGIIVWGYIIINWGK